MNQLLPLGSEMEVVRAFQNSFKLSANTLTSKQHMNKFSLSMLTHPHNLPKRYFLSRTFLSAFIFPGTKVKLFPSPILAVAKLLNKRVHGQYFQWFYSIEVLNVQ